MKKLMLYTILSIWLRHVIASKGVMSVVLQRCTSHCNPEYCKIVTVCRPLNRTSKFVSMNIYIHDGIKINAPVYIEIATFMKFATVYRPHMIKLKSELCEQLLFRTHPLFKLQKGESNLGNLLEPCPLTGHRYSKSRITNLGDYVWPLVPAGEWRFDITISLKRNGSEVVVVTWSDYYEIKTLTAEEF